MCKVALKANKVFQATIRTLVSLMRTLLTADTQEYIKILILLRRFVARTLEIEQAVQMAKSLFSLLHDQELH